MVFGIEFYENPSRCLDFEVFKFLISYIFWNLMNMNRNKNLSSFQTILNNVDMLESSVAKQTKAQIIHEMPYSWSISFFHQPHHEATRSFGMTPLRTRSHRKLHSTNSNSKHRYLWIPHVLSTII